MSEPEPPPYYYGYSPQNHPISSTQDIQAYQDWWFTRVAIQSTYPGIVQSRYPEFIGSPHGSYPELNRALQQDYPVISETPTLANYKKGIAKGLGVTQMVLGSAIMILNIVLISITRFSGATGYGIGCGILFFIAGLLGVISSRHCTRCTILSTMILSINSATVTPILFIRGFISVINPTEPPLPNADVIAVTIIMAILALVEMPIATAAAGYCCQVLSCCKCRGSQEYRMLNNASIEVSVPVPSAPLPDENSQTPFQSGVPVGFAGTSDVSEPPLIIL